MGRVTFVNYPDKSMDVKFPEVVTNTVAEQIIEDYEASSNQTPGGDCFAVSRSRFEEAYDTAYGNSVYDDLPEDSATVYYTPKEVFRNLYACSSGEHAGWSSLPEAFRGRGSAGAVTNADMGDIVNETGIWNGNLDPGALIQVWSSEIGYDEVVDGVDSDGYEGYGHSFIFVDYERNETNEIIGMNIADQGYQNDVVLSQNDYEVWWGVNITV